MISKRLTFVLGILFLFAFLLSFVGSVENAVSEANVSYDSNLKKAFEDKNYATNLMKDNSYIGLEIIDNQTYARIGVTLRDYSGIEIVGTKEERQILVNQRVGWFENMTNGILMDYEGESGFILRGTTSGGFGALVTEDVFIKLIKDERIDYLSWTESKVESTGSKYLGENYQKVLFILLFLIIIIFFLIAKKQNKKRGKNDKKT